MPLSRRLNLSGKEDSVVACGLISDSRMTKNSLRTREFLSPGRTSDYSGISYDENFISRRTTDSPNSSIILSPPKHLVGSPLRSSPLTYSRRYNSGVKSISKNSPRQRSSFSFSEDSPSKLKIKTSFLESVREGSPVIASRIASTANEMGVDEFPWVCPSVPVIPLIQSLPSSNTSPLRDTCTPRQNRVRIRLVSSHNSEISVDSSVPDGTTSIDEPTSAVKSVIQVLKEMSRKRPYTPPEEDEPQQEVKRRPEHNLYLSQLESEHENPPALPPRVAGEEDRKRNREPDWESPSSLGPKRRRTNTYIVNNEILSSLSSSIGMRSTYLEAAPEKFKKMVSIGTQVSLNKSSPDKKQSEQGAQTNLTKPLKEVKEAATMPDPPQLPSRPRSPVKEKVVANPNTILKSALSKFKIQPKDDTKRTDDLSAPLSFGSSDVQSSCSLPSSTNSFGSSTVQQSSLQSTVPLSLGTTSLSQPVTATPPQFSFASSDKNTLLMPNLNQKIGEINETQKENPGVADKRNDCFKAPELLSFKNNSSVSKPESPVTSQSLAPSHGLHNAPLVTSEGLKYKSPTNSNLPLSSASPFLFGASKSETLAASPLGIVKSDNIATSIVPTSTGTSTPSLPTVTSAPAPASSNVVTATKAFQFGISSDKSITAEPKKDKNSTNLFSFGKVDQKSVSITTKTDNSTNKPFQFGAVGGFSLGQNKKTVNTVGSPVTCQSNIESPKSLFTFGDAAKKEEKVGGFPFKLPTSTSNEQKQSFSFTEGLNSSISSTVSSSTIITVSTSTDTSVSNIPKSSAPIFPPSLFGSQTTLPAATNTAATTTMTSVVSSTDKSNVPSAGNNFTLPPFSITTSVGISTNSTLRTVTSSFTSSTPSIFGTNTTTTTSSVSLFGNSTTSTSTPSIFGSNTTTTCVPSLFGNVSTTSVPSLFGNSVTTTSTPTLFTNNASTTSISLFGSNSTTSSSPSVFGNNAISTATDSTKLKETTPIFGSGLSSKGNTSAISTVPAFGNSGASSTPIFGATPFSNSTTACNSSATFGTTTPAPSFGSTSAASPSFGSTSAASPAFGSTTTAASTFGSTAISSPAFGNNVTTASTFGSISTPTFGGVGSNPSTFGSTAVTTTSATPAFGSSVPAFGNSTQVSSTPSAFGNTAGSSNTFGVSTTGAGAATFGSTTNSNAPLAFGSTPVLGSNAPAFGSTTSSFGNTSTPTPLFGSQPQAFGNQSTPAFGSSSGFGSQSTFGSQSATPAFGTTPAFGSSSSTPAFGSSSAAPAFGSSTPAFGNTSTAPVFGSSAPSTFGASTTFGSTDATKPFTFNAPVVQPSNQTNTFNFTASQQPQASGSLFQFGASSTPQPNQPFQFNATQQTSSVGGGQQMFSIGSGSTAPRRVTARRKK